MPADERFVQSQGVPNRSPWGEKVSPRQVPPKTGPDPLSVTRTESQSVGSGASLGTQGTGLVGLGGPPPRRRPELVEDGVDVPGRVRRVLRHSRVVGPEVLDPGLPPLHTQGVSLGPL